MSQQPGDNGNTGPVARTLKDPDVLAEQPIFWNTLDVPTRRGIIAELFESCCHALRCNLEERARVYPQKCPRPDCQTSRYIVAHMLKCQLGSKCRTPNCVAVRIVLWHHQNCKLTTKETPYGCWLCGPLLKEKAQMKSALEKRNKLGIKDCKIVMHDFKKDTCPLASLDQKGSSAQGTKK